MRALGSEWAKKYTGRVGEAVRASRLPRGARAENQYVATLLAKVTSNQSDVRRLVERTHKDRATGERLMGVYDAAFIAWGLGSMQVAAQEYQRETGLDWRDLPEHRKALRMLWATGRAGPEMLGNFTAFMAGGAPHLLRGWKQDMATADIVQMFELARKNRQSLTRQDLEGEIAWQRAEADFIERNLERRPTDTVEAPDPFEVQRVLDMGVQARAGWRLFAPAVGAGPQQLELAERRDPMLVHQLAVEAEMREAGAFEDRAVLEDLLVKYAARVRRLTMDSGSTAALSTAAGPVTFGRVPETGDRVRIGDPVGRIDAGVGASASGAQRIRRMMELILGGRKSPDTITISGRAVNEYLDATEANELAIDAVPELASRLVGRDANGDFYDPAQSTLEVEIEGDTLDPIRADELANVLWFAQSAADRADYIDLPAPVRVHEGRRQYEEDTGETLAPIGEAVGVNLDGALESLRELPDRHELTLEEAAQDGLLQLLAVGDEGLRVAYVEAMGEAAGLPAFSRGQEAAQRAMMFAQAALLEAVDGMPSVYPRARRLMSALTMQRQDGHLSGQLARAMVADGQAEWVQGSTKEAMVLPGAITDMLATAGLVTAISPELGLPEMSLEAMAGHAASDPLIRADIIASLYESIPSLRKIKNRQQRTKRFAEALLKLVQKGAERNHFGRLGAVGGYMNLLVGKVFEFGRRTGALRTEAGRVAGEHGIRIEQRGIGWVWRVMQEIQTVISQLDEFFALPDTPPDHRRLLSLLIHKGTFRRIHTPEDFADRFGARLGPNTARLFMLGKRATELLTEVGAEMVRMGIMKQAQFDAWRNSYIRIPTIPTTEAAINIREEQGRTESYGPSFRLGDFLLHRGAHEAQDVIQVLDASLIIPRAAMREAGYTRLIGTISEMMNPRWGLVRRVDSFGDGPGQVPEHVLLREYTAFTLYSVESGQRRGRLGVTPPKGYVPHNHRALALGRMLREVAASMEPAYIRTASGTVIAPDGKAMRRYKEGRGQEREFTGLGSSDPSSPWFENTIGEGAYGAYPRTRKMQDLLDGALGVPARDGFAPQLVIERSAQAALAAQIDATMAEPTPFQNTVDRMVSTFRRAKT
ncbi:MAG: hypothetical protein ACYTFZ_07280, partial [Planctomycetota bacterium]